MIWLSPQAVLVLATYFKSLSARDPTKSLAYLLRRPPEWCRWRSEEVAGERGGAPVEMPQYPIREILNLLFCTIKEIERPYLV
ncbi:hypothetical protein [Kitasatospora sp. NPDC006786]|uniref:hypothetical protein n=1 Tax=unclassified Kitasatospora TaxID=2633591 RepID=UPI0033EC4FAC